MIENLKSINNPLTIILSFAAIAEIAGTVSLKLVNPELQYIFIWFVIGFPTLLILLFFGTLNLNNKVLYAPSDFKDEQNFINTMRGVSNVPFSLETAQEQLEEAKTQIIQDVRKELGSTSQEEENKLIQIFETSLKPFSETVEAAKESAEKAVNLTNQLTQRLDKEAINNNHLINYVRLNINLNSSKIPEGIDVESYILSNVKQIFKINPTILFRNKEFCALGIGLPEWVSLNTAKNYLGQLRTQTNLAIVESYFSGTREVRT